MLHPAGHLSVIPKPSEMDITLRDLVHLGGDDGLRAAKCVFGRGGDIGPMRLYMGQVEPPVHGIMTVDEYDVRQVSHGSSLSGLWIFVARPRRFCHHRPPRIWHTYEGGLRANILAP